MQQIRITVNILCKIFLGSAINKLIIDEKYVYRRTKSQIKICRLCGIVVDRGQHSASFRVLFLRKK